MDPGRDGLPPLRHGGETGVQHKPLRDYYDWTWFAREMNYAGYGRTIGTYTAQTPLTMLPMMAFTRFAPQTAKRIWLIFNGFSVGKRLVAVATDAISH